jgi:hypothetical protein
MKTDMPKTQDEIKQLEDQVVNELSSIPKRELTKEELSKLADMIMAYSQDMTGVNLYPYEAEFGWRIIYSLLSEDAEEVTALFARQMGKCLGEGTPVLMFDGTIKPVEQVREGDLLMGDDSTPRTVISTVVGESELFSINPNNGYHEPYIVNKEHILSLIDRRKGIVDIPLKKILGMQNPSSVYSGYKVPVAFEEFKLEVDPYWLGLWLGDGSSHDVAITTADKEVVSYLKEYAASLEMSVSTYLNDNKSDTYAITHRNPSRGKKNILREYLLSRGLSGVCNKHIPHEIKANSVDIRLKLLAGIIDSDGSKPTCCTQQSSCEVTFKLKGLAEDLQWLCRSLGFRAGIHPKLVGDTTYWRVWFYGELWRIPTRIPRKQYAKRRLRENPLSYGFTVKPEGVGRYYGFVLDGNKRFLLGDCTVTHNTETVAVTVCGLMVLLPILAKNLTNDPRISKFSRGVWIGIYAPNYEQAGILWSRMKVRMYSTESKTALLDPDVNIDLTELKENMVLPNGSFVDCGTASPQSNIEGKTYHLILLEETQDISSGKIRSSIHPMAAATAGTLVKIGTCNRVRSDFYDACRRNKRNDVSDGSVRSKFRRHYEYDYTVGQKYNPRYRKYIEKEKERLGEDSDDFRMKYRLHWLLDRGMFVNPELFDECGIKTNDADLFIEVGKGRGRRKINFTRSPNVVSYEVTSEGIFAAIDVGRANSTVVTVGKAFLEAPVRVGDSDRYPIHILNWLELYGDDHEAQHPQILAFLKNYRLSQVVIDATGKGDPVYSRLAADLDPFNVHVEPFIFTASSKDIGYKVFSQELSAKRFTFPAGGRATRLLKWQKFVNQMHDLEKEWRGQTMVVHKPKEGDNCYDDYPDSAMLLCWAVNVQGTMEIEEVENPFLGRAARWARAEALQKVGAFYKNVMEPKLPRRPPRPGHNGRWD